MTQYVVKGEILNHFFGEPSIGSVKYLKQQHSMKWGADWDWYVILQRARNHSMGSVINALKEEAKTRN